MFSVFGNNAEHKSFGGNGRFTMSGNDFLQTTTASPPRVLLTVRQFCNRHSFITEGGMRFQIFNRQTNGLGKSGAIVRLGRKILIDEEKYFGWMDSLQG